MGCLCIWMGKLLKCHLKGKICRKLANGQDIIMRKIMAPGLHLSQNWDYFLLYSNMFVGIYSRSQVSVYKTIGPLFFFCCFFFCFFFFLFFLVFSSWGDCLQVSLLYLLPFLSAET